MSADDLLPPNATPFEKAASAADRRVLSADADAIRRARDPAAAPAAVTPFLAWERSVHFYDPADEAGNRARTASSFADHTAYGSATALEAEIALDVGFPVKVREWFEERDLAFPGFAVEADMDPGPTPPDLDAVMASALKRRNVRDIPRPRVRVNQPPAHLYCGATQLITIKSANRIPRVLLPMVGATTRFLPQFKVKPL